MPYIKKELRDPLLSFDAKIPADVGELNFAITHLCKKYLALKGCRYQTINDIVGALEGAKLEFYRRIAAPYENNKKQENGDVF